MCVHFAARSFLSKYQSTNRNYKVDGYSKTLLWLNGVEYYTRYLIRIINLPIILIRHFGSTLLQSRNMKHTLHELIDSVNVCYMKLQNVNIYYLSKGTIYNIYYCVARITFTFLTQCYQLSIYSKAPLYSLSQVIRVSRFSISKNIPTAIMVVELFFKRISNICNALRTFAFLYTLS